LRDRPQVRAACVGTEDSPSGDEEDDELRDGSQYSSSMDDEYSSFEPESGTPTSGNSGDGSESSTERPQVGATTAEEPMESEDTKYVRAVRAKVAPAVEENPAQSSVNRKVDRPKHSKGQETCLAGWMRVNRVDVLTLFDSGSNVLAFPLLDDLTIEFPVTSGGNRELVIRSTCSATMNISTHGPSRFPRVF
jgi:hypothetical protein